MLAFCFAVLVGSIPTWCIAQDKEKKSEADVARLMSQGQRAVQAKKFDEAAKAFREVVEADPQQAVGWQMLGFALHSKGDLDEALVAHLKSTEFEETKQTGFYNMGCAYAMKKDSDKAFEFLNKAVSVGFLQMEFFETDTDLDNIRGDERFKKLVARVKNGGVEPFDVEALVGEWTFKSGKREGTETPAERLQGKVKFTKEKVTIPAGPGSEFVMKFTINTSKRVPQIDLEIESGPVNEGKALGLIKFEEGKLHLCYDPKGEKRPTKFDSTEENGFFLFVLEKAAEKE